MVIVDKRYNIQLLGISHTTKISLRPRNFVLFGGALELHRWGFVPFTDSASDEV
jgi:hypothetical protein